MRACCRLQPFGSFWGAWAHGLLEEVDLYSSDSYGERRVGKPSCRVWCPVQGDDFYFKKMDKQNGFQHRGLIDHVLAKRFINPGGPPVFKLQKKTMGAGGG